jgi:hypothetical protein
MEKEHFHMVLISATFSYAPKNVVATPSPSSAITIIVRILDEKNVVAIDVSYYYLLTTFKL